jgi:hypothetical protein
MHTQADPEAFPRLTARLVLRKAAKTYRQRFARVAIPAILVLVPSAVAETFADEFKREHVETLTDALDFALDVLTLATGVLSALALVFYAGLLDRLVGAHLFGEEDPSVRNVLKTLPYRKLIVADILLISATLVGLLLFILPGLMIFTLFCLVGPVINIEGRNVRDGFRDSARLVRPHFWLTLCLVTIPVIVESLIEEAIHRTVWERALLSSLVLNSLTAVLVLATVGLLEVVLAHELLVRDRARRAGEAGG